MADDGEESNVIFIQLTRHINRLVAKAVYTEGADYSLELQTLLSMRERLNPVLHEQINDQALRRSMSTVGQKIRHPRRTMASLDGRLELL